MSFTFRPAVRENVSLLISLAGGTGSGKTYSAMMLAEGMAGDKPFAVIDTEAGRAKHYADRFKFEHGDLTPPFRPERYSEAIKAADQAGYPVIVVDSASHEHAGEGGLLDWHDEELDRMAGNDWKKRESCKMAAWIKPKQSHKMFVQKLLQVRAHLILCFRAEEKVEMRRDDKGKMQILPKQSPVGLNGWLPICEKNLPFEMTASFLLTADRPGIPHPIKLQEQHRFAFPDGQTIAANAGRALAEWARGANPSTSGDFSPPDPSPAPPASPKTHPTGGAGSYRIMKSSGPVGFESLDQWKSKMLTAIDALPAGKLDQFRDINDSIMDDLEARDGDHAEAVAFVRSAFDRKMEAA